MKLEVFILGVRTFSLFGCLVAQDLENALKKFVSVRRNECLCFKFPPKVSTDMSGDNIVVFVYFVSIEHSTTITILS